MNTNEQNGAEHEVDSISLLGCPFCGAPAEIRPQNDDFQIVACSELSMLCPNPCMTVYKKDGKWDYSWWNRRQPNDNHEAEEPREKR